jgi:rod shape-determining protein MreC
VLKAKYKKTLVSLGWCLLFLLIGFIIPPFRPAVLVVLKQPLRLFTFIRRETGALIFFHRNFTQNERLRKENDSLKSLLNAGEEVSLENARLKELLSLKEDALTQKTIAAFVIGRSIDSWGSSIIIDKGRSSGIRRGMPVVSPLGLVGRVAEAFELTSKILLVNDPNLAVSAVDQRSRQEGLVTGTLGSRLIMRYLPQESDIQVDDVILTSGLNETFPKGLLIGKVIEVGREYSGLSSYAVVKPSVHLYGIEEVLVVVSP